MKSIIKYVLLVYAGCIALVGPLLMIMGHLLKRQFITLGQYLAAAIGMVLAIQLYTEKYPGKKQTQQN